MLKFLKKIVKIFQNMSPKEPEIYVEPSKGYIEKTKNGGIRVKIIHNGVDKEVSGSFNVPG